MGYHLINTCSILKRQLIHTFARLG